MTSTSLLVCDLHPFIEKVSPVFGTLNDSNWDQMQCYSNDRCKKCCIGAHLAQIFDVGFWVSDADKQKTYSSGYGIEAASRFVGCTIRQLELIFYAAGAPRFPFEKNHWDIPPILVLERMKYIITIPPEPSIINNSYDVNWVMKQQHRIAVKMDLDKWDKLKMVLIKHF